MAKPSAGATLDSGGSFFTGLLAAWLLANGSGGTSNDYKGTKHLTINHASWATDASSDPCLSVGTGAGTVDAVTLASGVATATSGNWSIAWRAQKLADDNAGMITGDGLGNKFMWMLGGSNFYLREFNGGDQPFAQATYTSQHDFVLTFNASDAHRLRFYVDGVEDSASPLVSALNPSDLLFDRIMCGYSSATFAFEGKLSYMYVWDSRTLTQTEAATLHSTPYVLFGSAGIAGTLSKTLDAATSTAAGAVAVAGAVSATLGACISSAAGTVSLSGVTSKTLGACTASAAGTVSLSAALTNTLSVLTSAATGTEAIAGVLTKTLGDATAGSAGTVDEKGALVRTLADVTLVAAGTGQVGAFGTVSATLGACVSNAAGTVSVSAVGASTLGSLVAGATGTVSLAGAVGATLSALSATGTGTIAVAAQVTKTLQSVSSASSGSVSLQGALNKTLGTLTLHSVQNRPWTHGDQVELEDLTILQGSFTGVAVLSASLTDLLVE